MGGVKRWLTEGDASEGAGASVIEKKKNCLSLTCDIGKASSAPKTLLADATESLPPSQRRDRGHSSGTKRMK